MSLPTNDMRDVENLANTTYDANNHKVLFAEDWNNLKTLINSIISYFADFLPYTGATDDLNLANKNLRLDAGKIMFNGGGGDEVSINGEVDGILRITREATINADLNLNSLTTSQEYIMPDKSGTFAMLDDIDYSVIDSASAIFTNKRIQPRTNSSTTNANLTPDLSVANIFYRTTQTAGLTINAPTGTPVIGEIVEIYVDSVSAQTLTINSAYKVFGLAFPASTTAGKTFHLSAQYNGTDWKTLWSNAV